MDYKFNFDSESEESEDHSFNSNISYDDEQSLKDLFDFLQNLYETRSSNIAEYSEILNNMSDSLNIIRDQKEFSSIFDDLSKILFQLLDDSSFLPISPLVFQCLIQLALKADKFNIEFPTNHLLESFIQHYSNDPPEIKNAFLFFFSCLPSKIITSPPFTDPNEILNDNSLSIAPKAKYFTTFTEQFYKEDLQHILEYFIKESIPECFNKTNESPFSSSDQEDAELLLSLLKKCLNIDINTTYHVIIQNFEIFMSFGSFLKEEDLRTKFLSIIYQLISQGFEFPNQDLLFKILMDLISSDSDHKMMSMIFFIFSSLMKSLKKENKLSQFQNLDFFLDWINNMLHDGNFALKIISFPLLLDLIMDDILTYPQYAPLYFHIFMEIVQIDDKSIFEKFIACTKHIFESLNENKEYQNDFITNFLENFNLSEFVEHAQELEIQKEFIDNYINFFTENFIPAS